MTITIRHKMQSAVADSNVNGWVKPTNWNDTHDILMDTGRLLGRATGLPGVTEEIAPDNGHMELVLSSGTPTLRLKDSGATAGTYTNPNVTVDAKGRVTSIENGANPSAAVAQAEAAAAAALAAQAAAEGFADDAAAAFDDFDDIFLGSHATDPTVDNDGDPLNEGDIYWNSAANDLRVYNGSAWQSTAGVGISAVVDDTSPQLGGDLDLNGFVIQGLEIGTDVQAWDAQLDEWATVDPSANGKSLVAAADYAAMKALLDLEIGTDVQAWDAQLDSLSAASANGVSLVTAANYAAMKALLDLEIGTDVQAWDAQLDSLSTASANGVSLVQAANYAAMRGLLDLEAGTDFYSIAGADAAFAAIGRTLTAGNGLTGGGTLAADRTFAVGGSTSIIVGADDVQRAALTGAIVASQDSNATTSTGQIVIVIDGGGSTITTGVKAACDFHATFPFTITGWTILGDQSGSIVVDVWKDTYANFPPTVADTIAGSEKPTISSAVKGQDTSLSTWTDTTIVSGDVLRFNVDSVTSLTACTIVLHCTKTG